MRDFSNLPTEILQHIFSFLDHKSRFTLLQVCRQWNAAAPTTQLMDRIWFRMVMRETTFMDQVNTLKYSSRKYRHVVVDCAANSILWSIPRSANQSLYLKIAEVVPAVDNLVTLVLFSMQDMTVADLLIMLQNVAKLRRLCLLGQEVHHLNELCFSDLPKSGTWWSSTSDTLQASWTEIFSKQRGLVLQNVTDVTLIVPVDLDLRVDVFQQMFPNLNQLQVTVNDLSVVHLIDACKDHLEKLSICSITCPLLTLFCDINFPKLSHLSLNTDFPLTQMAITKCKRFFENPDHTRNLRHLKLFIRCTSLIGTLCFNYTSLQVLEFFTTDVDSLYNISNLRNLQELCIRKREYKYYNSSLYQYSMDGMDWMEQFLRYERYDPIETLKNVKINGSFRSACKVLEFLHTMGPNLETLVLEDFTEPEEALRILSGSSPNLRHLELSFKCEPGKPSERNFGYLMNKTNLETLCLENVRINDDIIPKWIQNAPNLSTIVIASCKTLSVAHLTTLKSCCPRLKKLEIKGCKRITTQGWNEIQKNLPNIMVFYDKKSKLDLETVVY